MTNYIPQWVPPEPEEDHSLDHYEICPNCGSEEVLLFKVLHKGFRTVHIYECFDCDHQWSKLVPIDDDDIPF